MFKTGAVLSIFIQLSKPFFFLKSLDFFKNMPQNKYAYTAFRRKPKHLITLIFLL